MAAVLSGGMIGATALVAVSLQTIPFADPTAMEGPFAEFDATPIGSTRSTVTYVLGTGDPLARTVARPVEPAQPRQATDCSYWYTEEDTGEGTIDRFCFRDERLIEKVRFSLRTTPS